MQTCEHHIVQETCHHRGGFPIRRWRCTVCDETFTSRQVGLNPRILGTNPRARARNQWALRNWKRKQRGTREA